MAETDRLVQEMTDLERCTKQFAVIAARNAKFLSSQQKADQSFARIASRIIRSSKLNS